MNEIPVDKISSSDTTGVNTVSIVGFSEVPGDSGAKPEPLKETVVVPPQVFWCEECNPPKRFDTKKQYDDHKRYHRRKKEAEAQKSASEKKVSPAEPSAKALQDPVKIDPGPEKSGVVDEQAHGRVEASDSSPGALKGILSSDKLPLIILAILSLLGLGMIGLSFRKKMARKTVPVVRQPAPIVAVPQKVEPAVQHVQEKPVEEKKPARMYTPPETPAFLR